MLQLSAGANDTVDVEIATNECDGFNSAILPRHQVRPANTSQLDFALGPSARKRLRACTLDKYHQVLQFFCLDLGCQHVRGKFYLSIGLLDSIPVMGAT